MKSRREKKVLDLDAVHGEDEYIFTPLQMSRILQFLKRRLKAIVIGVSVTIALVILAAVVTVAAGVRKDNKLEHQNKKLQAQAEVLAVQAEVLKQAIIDIQDTRTGNQINNCFTQQEIQVAHNNLVLYLTHIPGTTRDPRAEDFEKKNLVPVRDCTPEGIKKYNEQQTKVEPQP